MITKRIVGQLFAVISMTLGAVGCDSSSSTPDEIVEITVAKSSDVAISSFQDTSTTLATVENDFAFPGDTVNLIAYVYADDSLAPADGGSVEFSAEIVVDDNTVSVPIGSAALAAGKAELDWETPTEYIGDYRITADYTSDGLLAPSRWRYSLHVARPDARAAMRYGMARLNHIVNLMNSPTSVDSLFEDGLEDGLDEDLAQVLRNEFDLQLIDSYYRAESFILGFTVPDVEKTLQAGGITMSKTHFGCVRTTMLVAANDDTLVIAIKGTDGKPNELINGIGSPSEFSTAPGIAVHPGWAWMADMLVQGFIELRCPVSTQDWPNPDFPGLTNLITQNRMDPTSGNVRQLYITGHSLGGALARMTAVQMAGSAMMSGDRVYTFGAPAQGAYNDVFGLDGYEDYGPDRFRTYGIKFEAFVGGRDPVPGQPESKTEKQWNEGLAKFAGWAAVWSTLGRATRCVADEIASWFGKGDGCKDEVLSRPIGYDIYRTSVFTSGQHPKLNVDGSYVRDDDSGDIEYHETDNGRAHWIGDYVFAMNRRARGDASRYNFYFPASRRGDIRRPLEIVALP